MMIRLLILELLLSQEQSTFKGRSKFLAALMDMRWSRSPKERFVIAVT